MTAGVWWLVVASSIAQSIEWMIKGQAMALRTNAYQNNSVWLDSNHLHCDKNWAHTSILLMGLMAGHKAIEQQRVMSQVLWNDFRGAKQYGLPMEREHFRCCMSVKALVNLIVNTTMIAGGGRRVLWKI